MDKCDIKMRPRDEKDIIDASRWIAKSRQAKAEMARPGERGYAQKPDDDWDGRSLNILACHDPNWHTAKCRGG